MRKNTDTDDRGHLFNVDILVKSPSNALALQYLLELLNSKKEVVDFQIKSGIKLGKLIDVMVQTTKESPEPLPLDLESGDVDSQEVAVTTALSEKSETTESAEITDTTSKNVENITAGNDPFEWIKQYSRDNRLVRLTTNQRGKQISLPCRILNFDEVNALVNVYHVDEKQVYTFKVNEIDEFSVSS
ncbi:hypothetical protein MKX64_16555 [Paenibacillus sp. FSL M8-0334]|uniref:hypothetical protein n=1 Tax=Paenibacillus sp. FSL M8-0334 TaxID=2921623 RepID=UPI0030F9AF0A